MRFQSHRLLDSVSASDRGARTGPGTGAGSELRELLQGPLPGDGAFALLRPRARGGHVHPPQPRGAKTTCRDLGRGPPSGRTSQAQGLHPPTSQRVLPRGPSWTF